MKFTRLMSVAWLLLAGFARTIDAQPGTMKQVVPGVWFREGDQKALGHCNNIVIEMKDYLIVVDANYPSGARAVIADAKKVSAKPIKYVIDSHHHSAHAYGNPVFTKMGAITIGHIGMVEELNRYEPAIWQREAKRRPDVAELNLPGPEPPKQTFRESPYVISDSSRRVELHYFGWGHTRGDTFVYLPKEKVLCTGDAVPSGAHSDPQNAYMGNWPNEIAAAQKLDVKYVLPAHGSYGGKELLEGERQFLMELYKTVETAVKRGDKLEQLVTMKDSKPMSTSVQLSKLIMDVYVYEGGKAMFPTRFANQVMATYLEITQKKPYGEIVGGK